MEAIEKAAKEFQEKLDAKNKELENSVNQKLEAIKLDATKSAEEKLKAVEDVLKLDIKSIQDRQNELDEAIAKKSMNEVPKSNSFGDVLATSLKENFESLRNVQKGGKISLDLKAVGNMTIAANLTGAGVITYQNQPALAPTPILNFRDLVPSVSSATGIYSLYRGSGTEGSISSQNTPGASKTQIDFDYTQATYTARYLSGFVRIDKSMMQDLPFLQSYLPSELLREFDIAENSKFYTDLTGVVTGSTTTPTVPDNDAEAILYYLANLMQSRYRPNGIVVNPAQWATLMMTAKGNFYSVPGGITIDSIGQMRIAGVPIYVADWVGANRVIVGDWTRAKRVVTDDLKIQFFEQDDDNVQRNLVTVRIECREVLAIDRLDAFVFANMASIS